jgi:ketosteroid isomerase-like protein
MADSPRAVFERCARLGLAGDAAAQAAMYAEDAVLEFPFAPPGVPQRLEGRAAIGRLLAALGRQASGAGMRVDEGASQVVVHETGDPEVIVAEVDACGEVAATGARFRRRYVQVYRVRDGAIVSMRDYWGPETGEGLKSLLG